MALIIVSHMTVFKKYTLLLQVSETNLTAVVQLAPITPAPTPTPTHHHKKGNHQVTFTFSCHSFSALCFLLRHYENWVRVCMQDPFSAYWLCINVYFLPNNFFLYFSFYGHYHWCFGWRRSDFAGCDWRCNLVVMWQALRIWAGWIKDFESIITAKDVTCFFLSRKD